MNFRQLDCFVRVIDAGNMTRAAERLSATLLGVAFIALVALFVLQGMSQFRAQED